MIFFFKDTTSAKTSALEYIGILFFLHILILGYFFLAVDLTKIFTLLIFMGE